MSSIPLEEYGLSYCVSIKLSSIWAGNRAALWSIVQPLKKSVGYLCRRLIRDYLELTLEGVAAPDGQFIAPGDIITPPWSKGFLRHRGLGVGSWVPAPFWLVELTTNRLRHGLEWDDGDARLRFRLRIPNGLRFLQLNQQIIGYSVVKNVLIINNFPDTKLFIIGGSMVVGQIIKQNCEEHTSSTNILV